jgi:hypothetical protein
VKQVVLSLLLLLPASPAPAGTFTIVVTDVAAVTTIAVNALEIRSTIKKARAVAARAKRMAEKAAKKVVGK